MLEITQDGVVYEAQTRLLELGLEVARSRSLRKAKKEISQGFRIYAYLQALEVPYLSRSQREKLWNCLVQIADINDFPVAPVLGVPDRPDILIGSSSTVTNNITYDGGTPVSNTDVDTGTEVVDSIPTSTAKGAFWHYVIRKGSIQESGFFRASWIGAAFEYSQEADLPIGGTIDVTLSLDINSGNARLLATASSDNWAVYTIRYLVN